MVEIRHLENRHDVNFYSEGGLIWIKFRRLVQNDMSIAVMWSKSKPEAGLQYGGRFGEFNGMSSKSHVLQPTVQGERIPSAILKIVFRRILFIFLFS